MTPLDKGGILVLSRRREHRRAIGRYAARD